LRSPPPLRRCSHSAPTRSPGGRLRPWQGSARNRSSSSWPAASRIVVARTVPGISGSRIYQCTYAAGALPNIAPHTQRPGK
jgi:hypothetical protein